MANHIIGWVYTDDGGREYVMGVNSELTTQLVGGAGTDPKIGGRAVALPGDADLPPLPASVKPRRVMLFNPAGVGRTVTAFDPAAAILTRGTTLSIEDSDGSATTFSTDHSLPESFGRKRRQIT